MAVTPITRVRTDTDPLSWRHINFQGEYNFSEDILRSQCPSCFVGRSRLFSCTVDGDRRVILYIDIQYIESLENYLKISTKAKTYVTRLTLKEAEERLPRPLFISRSVIVNSGLDRKSYESEKCVSEMWLSNWRESNDG